jgi:hypothetical protein
MPSTPAGSASTEDGRSCAISTRAGALTIKGLELSLA